jgi:hypothetical protein
MVIAARTQVQPRAGPLLPGLPLLGCGVGSGMDGDQAGHADDELLAGRQRDAFSVWRTWGAANLYNDRRQNQGRRAQGIPRAH